MTKTRQDLVTRALHKLGVISSGQAAAAEDYTLVDGSVDPVLSDLATRNVYQWGDPDQLDEDAFEHLAGLVALANAKDFGKDPDENERQLLESRLRQLKLTFLSGQPQRAEYF